MIYSTSCGYAIQALCRLDMLRPKGYLRINEICSGTDLPEYFVAKICRDLVQSGLLVSSRGRGGGFSLARASKEISLYDIVIAVDGDTQFNKCVTCHANCNDKQPCGQHEHFKPVRKTILDYLRTTTLQEISQALATKSRLLI